MAAQVDGVCNIKIKLFYPPPLFLVLQGGLSTNLTKPGAGHPHTPLPHRKSLLDDPRPRREALSHPPFKPPHKPVVRFDYDDDEEKENEPPESRPPKDDEPTKQTAQGWSLSRLLRQWEQDIERFRQQVYQDLEDFKLRLGIHLQS
ncbi:E4 [Gammapapillomavirus 25]|uniref:E4 n=2 Tax=Papillomaviridae TaxID=151340 RepID=A0A0K1YWQ6_9PAPI|nr:E4 [Human papillomavirus]AKZ17783.1 E4 [Human papillomavirus]ATQ38606.1 E4 [Gammapapillomavirus 25]QAB14000.1 MAG: E4 protein [Human papillomavirus]